MSLRQQSPWELPRSRSSGRFCFRVKPSLLIGAAISTTTILGYSAMAGAVGGGGLGGIAINYGYYRYETDIMLVVAILVIIVQVIQRIGMRRQERVTNESGRAFGQGET